MFVVPVLSLGRPIFNAFLRSNSEVGLPPLLGFCLKQPDQLTLVGATTAEILDRKTHIAPSLHINIGQPSSALYAKRRSTFIQRL
jgi:hypothetical protein